MQGEVAKLLPLAVPRLKTRSPPVLRRRSKNTSKSSGFRKRRCFALRNVASKLKHALLHDFTRFEFHCGACRDSKAAAWHVRVASDALFAEAHLEHTEIANFDILAGRKTFGDTIEGHLNYGKDLLLGQSRLVADLDHKIPFSEVSHNGY